MEILKIHAGPITKHGEIDYEAVVKLRFVCYNLSEGGGLIRIYPFLHLHCLHITVNSSFPFLLDASRKGLDNIIIIKIYSHTKI